MNASPSSFLQDHSPPQTQHSYLTCSPIPADLSHIPLNSINATNTTTNTATPPNVNMGTNTSINLGVNLNVDSRLSAAHSSANGTSTGGGGPETTGSQSLVPDLPMQSVVPIDDAERLVSLQVCWLAGLVEC